jgi:hypothetical protein
LHDPFANRCERTRNLERCMEQHPHDGGRCAACADSVTARLNAIEAQQRAMAVNLAANTEITKEVKELLELGRTAFRLADYVGRFVRWTCGIAAAVGAAYAAWQAARGGGK